MATTKVKLLLYPSVPGTDVADKTLALRLGRDRRYPSRDALLRFGREVCHVPRPEPVLERIAEAMRTTWADHRGLFPSELGQRLWTQWGEGLKLT